MGRWSNSPGREAMAECGYLMESEAEAIRLDVKTNSRAVERQARRAGLKAGMRVADLGCGSGKTTFHLHKLVQPGGSALGVDIAAAAHRLRPAALPRRGA